MNHVDQAMQALGREDYTGAVDALRSANDGFTPSYVRAAAHFGIFLSGDESWSDLREAYRHAQRAQALQDDHFDVNLLLGQCAATFYLATGCRLWQEEAKQSYDHAATLSRNRPGEDPGELEARLDSLCTGLEGTTELVQFTARERIGILHDAHPGAHFYDTSTHTPMARDHLWVEGLAELSPFYKHGNLPVLGTDMTGQTVEGIWQGLKIIKGKTDFSFFSGKGRKRKGRVEGHKLGRSTLGYLDARRRIFVPTYEHMLRNSLRQEFFWTIFSRARAGAKQFFFDVDSNPRVEDLSSPLAHSSVLVHYLNKELSDHCSCGDASKAGACRC